MAARSAPEMAPAPWAVSPGIRDYGIVDAAGTLIAQTLWEFGPDRQHEIAYLLAAAPELLAAVQRAHRHAINIGIGERDSTYFAQLEAALAKAKAEPV